MGSQGNVINYNNLIIPENEKDSPWPPFHVQKGFKPEENVISFFFGFSITQGQGGRRPRREADSALPRGDVLQRRSVRFAVRRARAGLDPLVANGLVELGLQHQGRARRLAAEEYDRLGEGRQVDALQRAAERPEART